MKKTIKVLGLVILTAVTIVILTSLIVFRKVFPNEPFSRILEVAQAQVTNDEVFVNYWAEPPTIHIIKDLDPEYVEFQQVQNLNGFEVRVQTVDEVSEIFIDKSYAEQWDLDEPPYVANEDNKIVRVAIAVENKSNEIKNIDHNQSRLVYNDEQEFEQIPVSIDFGYIPEQDRLEDHESRYMATQPLQPIDSKAHYYLHFEVPEEIEIIDLELYMEDRLPLGSGEQYLYSFKLS